MKNTLIALTVGAATLVGGAAQAALLEFDVNGVPAFGPTGFSGLSGTFEYDTTAMAFTDVSVTGAAGEAYNSAFVLNNGVVSSGVIIDFFGDASGFMTMELVPFNLVMPGLAVGDMAFLGVFGAEISGGEIFDFIDGTVKVTRLPDPVIGGEVPLPAGFPLLLAGLGAFAWVRRREA